MTKILTAKKREALEEKAQGFLEKAQELLDKAAELAEEGMFNLSFQGADYYPESLHGDGSDDTESVAKRLGLLKEDESIDEWDDDKVEELEAKIEELNIDDYLPEYAATGEWWSPSTC